MNAPEPSHRRSRRSRRLVGLAVLALVVVVVGLAAFTAWQALHARSALLAAQADLTAAKTSALNGDTGAASQRLADAARETAAARTSTDGPVWRLAAHLPWVGASVHGVSVTAAQADVLASRVLPPLIAAARTLQPDQLRVAGARLDLAPMARVSPQLTTALRQVDGVRKSVDALDTDAMLGAVARPVASFQAQLADLQTSLRGLDLAARLAPPMLGESGVRRYLVAFQNPAESRGTGGLLGAYAVLQADHGRISLVGQGSDSSLETVRQMPIDLGPDFEALYNDDPALWVNSNESPHFPYAAKIWLALWQQQRGQQLDGVIAVDPIVLSRLLRVTGPVTLPDGEQITADNVVRKTLSEAYARFASADKNDERKAYLLEVSAASISALFSGHTDARSLVKALGESVDDRRLMVYSTRANEERSLVSAGLAGVLPQTAAPFAMVSVVNAKGTKLDYYLDRRISYTGSACRRSDGTRETQVSVQLHSDVAPGTPLPDYVDGVPPAGTPRLKRNDNRLMVTLYATTGASLVDLRVNGRSATFAEAVEQGHPAFQVMVDVPASATVTVTWSLEEPVSARAAGKPLVPVQPLVRPADVSVSMPACS
ncbi:MAG: DUF4012 domain-containing protein [Actinomycetales bacterium]